LLKEKKGVLATRSPHRPNPIGVTLAQVYRIDKKKRVIELRACDLVDGTPVLDVKPYVPSYDTTPSFRIPTWIEETIETRNIVRFASNVQSELANDSIMWCKQYRNDSEGLLKGLRETLEAEVRSKFQTKKRLTDAERGQPCEVFFDECLVNYLWINEREMEVISIKLKDGGEGAVEKERQQKRKNMKEYFRAIAAAEAAGGGKNSEVEVVGLAVQAEGKSPIKSGTSTSTKDVKESLGKLKDKIKSIRGQMKLAEDTTKEQ